MRTAYSAYLHLAEWKLVGVEQYIRTIEKLRGELLHVRHVVLISTPSPALAQVVEQAVGAVETPALTVGGVKRTNKIVAGIVGHLEEC